MIKWITWFKNVITYELEFPKQWRNKRNCLLFCAGFFYRFYLLKYDSVIWKHIFLSVTLQSPHHLSVWNIDTLLSSSMPEATLYMLETLIVKCSLWYETYYISWINIIDPTSFLLLHFIFELFSIFMVMTNIFKLEFINATEYCQLNVFPVRKLFYPLRYSFYIPFSFGQVQVV